MYVLPFLELVLFLAFLQFIIRTFISGTRNILHAFLFTFCSGYTHSVSYSDKCHDLIDYDWQESSSLTYARQRASCTYLNNGSFWVAGGIEHGRYLSVTELRDSTDDNFSISTELPKAMYSHCIVNVNESHFFIGGSFWDRKVSYLVDTEKQEFEFPLFL